MASESQLSVVRIEPGDVRDVWPTVQAQLKRALKYGDGGYSIFDIKTDCMNGEYALWVATDGARVVGSAVAGIRSTPRFRVGVLFLLGGTDFKRWVNALDDALTGWAIENGVKSLEGYCRPGFERIVPWTKTHIVVRKEL